MARSVMQDAFAHHVWATIQLLGVCDRLSSEQRGATAPGTYGTILQTARHLVGADGGYLYALTAGRAVTEEDISFLDDEADFADLAAAMDKHGRAWAALLAEKVDPDEVVVRQRRDGSETHAPVGIRLAQALHHGSDHRSQLCTALTLLGVEPPFIDAWDFSQHVGSLVEIPPKT